MDKSIFYGILTGFSIGYGYLLAKLIHYKKALRKERIRNNHIVDALNDWLVQEKKFARDKNTFAKAMQNTKTPLEEGFSMVDMAETISTGSEMINESYHNAEKAKYELLEKLAQLEEGKEETQ